MKHITITPPLRGHDRHGSGAYQAPRGNRTHNGIDYACPKDSEVRSVCAGKVTKLGYPYSQKDPDESWPTWKKEKHLKKKAMRYVQVTDIDSRDVRYFYIKPSVDVGDEIRTGDIIGVTQGLTDIYPDITDHFHFEIKENGSIINPHDYLGE